MNVIVQLVLLTCAIAIAALVLAIHRRLGETTVILRRLLAFLDGAHVERRKDRQGERNDSSIFWKTVTDTLVGCRNSIDAIRSVTDELSEHRRETVEVRGPLLSSPLFPHDRQPETRPAPTSVAISEGDKSGDRDSEELLQTRVALAPTAAELAGTAPYPPTSEAAQAAAGLSRPKSSRQAPPPRPVRTDPPPRAALPMVLPPPIARARTTTTLPSMRAPEAQGAASRLPTPQKQRAE